ncbi:MAG TPA: ABC transporter ATP-binding protein [Anaerolineaceae bacterium]|nr:ABC transporter ATP-binding protein [Anaerolineaceae bacterium]
MVETLQAERIPPRDLVITATGLTKQYDDFYAVRDLTFDIARGSIFGFIGPSGSGKTTTVRMLTGIYRPTAGEAHVLGFEPQKFTPAIRERIGYMPQLFVLYPDLSIWENMSFIASIYGLSPIGRAKKINGLLDFVELTEAKNRQVRKISGGMQRRLTLAATLLHDPELIFFDEPTTGIDPILRRKIWDHFAEMQKQGTTLFVTTQYVGEAAYCDFVGVMAEGKLLMVDTPDGLRRRAFGGDVIDIQTKSYASWDVIRRLQELPFIRGEISVRPNNTFRITVDDASTALPELLEWLSNENIETESSRQFLPPFDDVFVTLVQNEVENA